MQVEKVSAFEGLEGSIMDTPGDQIRDICRPFIYFTEFCNEVRTVRFLPYCVDELARHSLPLYADSGYTMWIVWCA